MGLLAIVLSGGNLAAGREGGGGAEITVLVNNSAGVSQAILNQAESETARIFRAAGIDIVWVDCIQGSDMVDDVCRRVPGLNDFVLHLVPEGRTSSDWVFGLAFLGEDGAGKYSDVFYDRVQHRQRELGTSRLLGAVAAHELGHLLLGSHAHSYGGIMAAVWEKEILCHMEMGGLLFSRDQAARMRARVSGDERTLLSVGPGTK